ASQGEAHLPHHRDLLEAGALARRTIPRDQDPPLAHRHELRGRRCGRQQQREERGDERELHPRREPHRALFTLSPNHSASAVAASENHVSAYSRCFATPASGVSCTASSPAPGASESTITGSTLDFVASR